MGRKEKFTNEMLHLDYIRKNITDGDARFLVYNVDNKTIFGVNGNGGSLIRMLIEIMGKSSDAVDILRTALMFYDGELNPDLLDDVELN